MRIFTCEQHSDEWFAARLGIPTSSNFSKIVTGKGEPSKQRTAYLYELAAQRLTGVRDETFKSTAMEEGNEREELSRQVYEMEREVVVDQVGICLSDCERWGASPDGLIGNDGLLELKNPLGKTQVERLLTQPTLPASYVQQVQGQIFVTGRDWCDFVSYVPGLPLFVLRVHPDVAFLKKLKPALIEFCDELDEICARIKEIGAEMYAIAEVANA